MTQLEQYLAMLEQVGIVFDRDDTGDEVLVRVETSGTEAHSKQRGYFGFFTNHVFDSAGRLLRVEVWE